MLPKTAYIKSHKDNYLKKICGLYALERNIRLLWQAGVSKFILELSDAEKELFNKKILKKVKKLKNITFTQKDKQSPIPKKNHFEIYTNHFLQFHNFIELKKYFNAKNQALVPKITRDIFIIKNHSDAIKGEKIALKHIRNNTGGWFARNINKHISIPLSRIFIRLGIHPNILTLVNMFFAFAAAYLITFNDYWSTLAGGALFQWVSIFDGCDGEVAKLTCKFSKFGSWFDTFNDYLAAIIFLGAGTYRFLLYFNFSKIVIFAIVIPSAISFTTIVSSIIFFLRHYSHSRSFTAYDKEFLQKLPENDWLVKTINNLNIFTRKEFFSLFAFIFALLESIEIYMGIAFLSVTTGALLATSINKKYFKYLPFEDNKISMAYISRR